MEPQEGNSSSSIQFQWLPPEALARVLGAVPQQHRLVVCALVCRAWRNAALAATTQLELKLSRDQPQRSAQLSAWLARHGSRLLSLFAHSSHFVISLELPWASLRQLQALRLDVLKTSCSSSTASQAGPDNRQQLAQLTSLTRLVLDDCTITSGVLDLYQQQLPALAQLQELALNWRGRDQAWTADGFGAALAAALTQLTGLTCLQAVVTPDGAAAVISSLSSLRQLQDLGLQGTRRQGGDDTDPSISWSEVPASVTALELSGTWQLQAASGAGCPLTALQRLKISFKDGFGFPGLAALSRLPQLQQLDIKVRFGAIAFAGTRALLALVAQQQQLQSLGADGDIDLPADQMQHYAALAASSQLTSLRITVAEETPAPALLSAIILGAGRRLRRLQQLMLWTDDLFGRPNISWGLAPQDVSRLLQACPGLRELDFVPARRAAAAAAVTWSHVAGAAAAQLTKLEVAGNGVNAAFAAQFLAQLTGLQDLEVAMSDHITLAELAPLTRLTRLTRLRVFCCGPYDEELESYLEFEFTNEAWPGQPPDVAQQLRALCWSAAPAVCLLSKQVEQQQQQLAEQRARIADLEARLAVSDAALARSETALAAAEAALAAAAAAGFVVQQ